MKNILKIEGLTKYYGNILGIKQLNLELYTGEIFGFIGPNGAGKSTTIRSIMNLINKNSGKIFFNDMELTKDSVELKKDIGYLPSEIHLYDDFTVKEMLDYNEKFYTTNISKRRKELVKRLDLDEQRKIEDLSLGNLKKLGIVLAFMHSPKLLILDEPTSGLDPIIQQEFYKILMEEKKKGTTIFYSTHILSEISKICDRVGIIKDGELLKIESIEDLYKKNLTFVTLTSDDIEKIIDELNINFIMKEEKTVKFKNFIEFDKLLKTLSRFKIDKILIEEASLEEMLLHFYK